MAIFQRDKNPTIEQTTAEGHQRVFNAVRISRTRRLASAVAEVLMGWSSFSHSFYPRKFFFKFWWHFSLFLQNPSSLIYMHLASQTIGS